MAFLVDRVVINEHWKALRGRIAELVARRIELAGSFAGGKMDTGSDDDPSDTIAHEGDADVINAELDRLQICRQAPERVQANGRTDKVRLGSVVLVLDTDAEETFTYVIVGDWSPTAGNGIKWVSHRSPVGLALVGKQVGEEVGIDIPRGSRHLVIVEIKQFRVFHHL